MEVGDVPAVGVVRLVRHEIPVEPDCHPGAAGGRCGSEVAEQSELHEVADVSRIPVLHTQSLLSPRQYVNAAEVDLESARSGIHCQPKPRRMTHSAEAVFPERVNAA